ncbi:MAG TPA: anti-sigma factor [Solirubrobacterales bacterium]|nr:anti-sigma factor [Solirubrobacterales bacterium]
MNETNHNGWQEDVAAYMLGALEPERAAELERHLDDCERCRAEVRWLMPALNALPQSVERQQAPPQLRERLMAEVCAEAAPAESERAGAGGLLQRAGAWLRGLGSGPMGLRPVAGIVAAVLVVAAVAGYAIEGGIGGGDEGGSTETVVSGKPPGVTAKMVTKDGGESGTLHLANVQQLHDERVLQAWVQREGEVEPVRALFVPDDEGHASTAIADMEGVEVVMVTTEPRGGSEAPTSSPIVTMPIPQS